MPQDETYKSKNYSATPLEKGTYDNCIFSGCVFTNSDLTDVVFEECEFEGCDFSMAKVVNTAFREAKFRNCKFLGVRLEDCNKFLLSMSFDSCQLNMASLYQIELKHTQFNNCNLQEADLTEANLTASIFNNCDFTGATFYQTNIEKCDFRAAHSYIIDPEMNRIGKAKFSLSGVAGLLYNYDIEID